MEVSRSSGYRGRANKAPEKRDTEQCSAVLQRVLHSSFCSPSSSARSCSLHGLALPLLPCPSQSAGVGGPHRLGADGDDALDARGHSARRAGSARGADNSRAAEHGCFVCVWCVEWGKMELETECTLQVVLQLV